MSVEFTGGNGKVNIPEYQVDPVSPANGDTWVLFTPSGVGGTPIGLLLALTQTIGEGLYQLSYQTIEGEIIRVIMD